jgi:nitrogen-specific signal transduction histidine kinase
MEDGNNDKSLKIDEEVRSYADSILKENDRLQKLVNALQAENHQMKNKVSYILILFFGC